MRGYAELRRRRRAASSEAIAWLKQHGILIHSHFSDRQKARRIGRLAPQVYAFKACPNSSAMITGIFADFGVGGTTKALISSPWV
jgi:hypothetical protein